MQQEGRAQRELLVVRCRGCEATSRVAIQGYGSRFMSALVSHCPRCGAANIDAEQLWGDDGDGQAVQPPKARSWTELLARVPLLDARRTDGPNGGAPAIHVAVDEGAPARHLRRVLYAVAAEVEQATPERESWLVQIESLGEGRGRVYLELGGGDPLEPERAAALMFWVSGRISGLAERES